MSKQGVLEFLDGAITRQLSNYERTRVETQMASMASLFMPGPNFIYIVNFHDMNVDYVSESVEDVLGVPPEEFTLSRKLELVPAEEAKVIELKGRVTYDFYSNYLEPWQQYQYRSASTFRIRHANGQLMVLLHQIWVLKVAENGLAEHLLCIDTNIDHLKTTDTSTLSFIHNSGGKSFYDVPVTAGRFIEPSDENTTDRPCVSERERQVLQRLAAGKTSAQIGEELNISVFTVRSHRRNLLKRLNAASTPELVALGLAGGYI